MDDQSLALKNSEEIMSHAAFAVGILREGDAQGEVDELVARELEAEGEFRKRAYAAWPKFPDHPIAPALAGFHRHLNGQDVNPAVFSGLAWLGSLLPAHRDDWQGWEAAVGARLRSPENFQGCLFELETSGLLRELGHSTRWLWPSHPGDADLVIDGSVDVECVHARDCVGTQIPRRAAGNLLSSVLVSMRKHRRNLMVLIEVHGALHRGDTPTLRSEIDAAIRAGQEGQIRLSLTGYTVQMETLAPFGVPVSASEYTQVGGLHPFEQNRMGLVERSPLGLPANPRLAV